MGLFEPHGRYGGRHRQAALTAGRAIVVMGVSGTGKSTVGQALAQHLGCPFLEGDAFHSDAARAKMAAGIPLTDADRAPWLARLGTAIGAEFRRTGAVVAACSALKNAYRQALADHAGTGLSYVWLHAPEGLIHRRMRRRKNHYMPASLLGSQFATLEVPEGANVFPVDASRPKKEMVRNVLKLFPAQENL